MAAITKIAFIAALLAVIIGCAGVSYAYAYSPSVNNTLGVESNYISIDIHTSNDLTEVDATPATSVSFNIEDATIALGGSRVEIIPTTDYILRISSDVENRSVSLMGAFSLYGSSSAGAAVKSVTFVFTDSNNNPISMPLAGGHYTSSETAPSSSDYIKTFTLSSFDDYYSCGLKITKIVIDLVAEVNESSDGKAYVAVSGSSGNEVLIDDLVNPNALCYNFITYGN